MANNSLVTPEMITFKTLDEFLNNLKIVPGFNTEWASQFGKKGNKIGDQLKIRKPQRWLVKSGATYQEQPIQDTFTTVTIDRHRHIGFDYGAFETVLSLDDMYNRYFKTSNSQLSNQVDDEAAQWAYLNTNNVTGTLGTNPASLADAQGIFMDAYALMLENGTPADNLSAVIGPRMAAAVMKYFNTNFNPTGSLGEQFKSGTLMSSLLGFARTAVDQNLYDHTAGVFVGTPAVATNSVNGATSIATDGWTSGDQVKAGDVFAIATVKNVNPKNRRSTGQDKRFVVAADATADGSGLMTIQLGGGMAIYDASQQQANVDDLPVDGDLITMWPGTTSPSGKGGKQSLAFGPDAFAFLPITLPDVGSEGAFCAQATDPKTGISMTMIRQVNAETYRRIARVDIGYGFGNLYPDQESVRMVGAA